MLIPGCRRPLYHASVPRGSGLQKSARFGSPTRACEQGTYSHGLVEFIRDFLAERETVEPHELAAWADELRSLSVLRVGTSSLRPAAFLKSASPVELRMHEVKEKGAMGDHELAPSA